MNAPALRLVTVVTALAAGAGPARASGFQLREQDSTGLGNAYAGSTAKADDASTLFYNPAGMTRLDGNQGSVSAAWLAPSSRFSGGATVGGAPIAGSDGGDHARSLAVGAAYALWDATPDWRAGVSITAPFGMRSDYNEDWVGRYHALDTSLAAVNLSPSVAYRVGNGLSLGAGLQIGYIDLRLTNALNFAALVPGAGDGLFRVTGDDVALGWTASALYEIDAATRLGLAYRSSIRHAIQGSAQFQGVPGALAGNTAFADSGIDTAITLPDTVTLGLYHDISPHWTMMSDIAWTHWSEFRTFRLEFDSGRPDLEQPQNWHDTWFFSLGVTWRPNDRLGLHLGTAYDMSPVDDAFRTPRLPDSDRIWLSGGLTYAIAPGHRLNLSYAHIFGGSVGIDRTDPQGGGRLVGEYDNHVDVISVGYALTF